MKKKFLLLSLMMAMLPFLSVNVNAAKEEVYLQVGHDDPTTDQGKPQKSPVLVPEISIDGYTLTFDTPCDGYTLCLLNEDGEAEYTTIVPAGATSLVLPSWLSGEYEILLIPNTGSSIYFYGFIMF